MIDKFFRWPMMAKFSLKQQQCFTSSSLCSHFYILTFDHSTLYPMFFAVQETASILMLAGCDALRLKMSFWSKLEQQNGQKVFTDRQIGMTRTMQKSRVFYNFLLDLNWALNLHLMETSMTRLTWDTSIVLYIQNLLLSVALWSLFLCASCCRCPMPRRLATWQRLLQWLQSSHDVWKWGPQLWISIACSE